MNYSETLSYIMKQLPMFQRIGKAAYRTGLDNTYKLDEYFRSPHRKFKTIHIAGTNGKGSVSHMLASILHEAGYNTGLYTSPHLTDFRERIRVNGKMITKSFVTDFIDQHKSFFETFDPSFFEISVFMAFEYFSNLNVDVAVIEVGLGGRLDATNIITPVLSVITNIGKDHTEILGDTIEKIASEKAGIIKPGVPVVIGESQPETLPVYHQFCQKNSAPMVIADSIYKLETNRQSFEEYQVFNVLRYGRDFLTGLKCGLLGHYQQKNVATVLASVDELTKLPEENRIPVTAKHVQKGLKNVITNTGLAGRWQIIRNKPLVVCDTAHNTDGIRAVLQQVKSTPFKQLHLILGFVNDKDVQEIMHYLPVHAEYYFVRLSVPRSMDEKELALNAAAKGLKGKAYVDIASAYSDALKKSGTNDFVLITGSNFLVADFLTNMCLF